MKQLFIESAFWLEPCQRACLCGKQPRKNREKPRHTKAMRCWQRYAELTRRRGMVAVKAWMVCLGTSGPKLANCRHGLPSQTPTLTLPNHVMMGQLLSITQQLLDSTIWQFQLLCNYLQPTQRLALSWSTEADSPLRWCTFQYELLLGCNSSCASVKAKKALIVARWSNACACNDIIGESESAGLRHLYQASADAKTFRVTKCLRLHPLQYGCWVWIFFYPHTISLFRYS